MARYEKLTRRRCRLWAPIRSGTGIPEPLSAINNRSTSREKERERKIECEIISPFPVEREKRIRGGVFVDEPKIHAYRQSRSNNFESRKRRKRETAKIQMDDIWRMIENMIEAFGYLCDVSATNGNIFILSHPKCDDAVRKIRSRRLRAITNFRYVRDMRIILKAKSYRKECLEIIAFSLIYINAHRMIDLNLTRFIN